MINLVKQTAYCSQICTPVPVVPSTCEFKIFVVIICEISTITEKNKTKLCLDVTRHLILSCLGSVSSWQL